MRKKIIFQLCLILLISLLTACGQKQEQSIIQESKTDQIFVEKVALLWCRWLGGPPRLGAGRVSDAGRKAGSEVGPLDAIPRRWVTEWGGLAPVGIASLRCPAGHRFLSKFIRFRIDFYNYL